MRFSHIVFAFAGLILVGCQAQPVVPTLPATTRITAQINSVPDMGIESIDHVEVPEEYVAEILKIVTPVTFVESGIRPELNYHVADVFLHHQDSKVTKIEVRFTGHNPAAVTVDGSNYFYASTDGPVDGARALANRLTELHWQAQQVQPKEEL